MGTSDAQVLQFTQSGELLRNVMDHAAVGMALLGAGDRLMYANAAFCEMLGYADRDLMDLTIADLTPDNRTSAAFVQFERLRAGAINAFKAECQYKRKNGSPIWVLLSASIMRGSGGRPWQIILQLSDIDRVKKAEEALSRSESRWNFALEAARQGVWEHDIRLDRMYYSRMGRRMRGFADDEEVDDRQEAWLSRMHPDDRAHIRAVIDKQDTGEDGYDTIEYRELHRDGHYLWILSRGKPIEWDANGHPVRTIGTDTDITPLKQAEARLAREKEWLRVTLQSIGDGVISTDASGRISFMNDVAADLTQWQAGDATNKPLAEIFQATGEDTGETIDPVAECLGKDGVWRPNIDYVLTGQTGSTCHIRQSAAPVKDEDGRTLGTVIVFRDTTESRRLERELAYSAAHDSLTGLPNRATFEKKLNAAIDDAGAERHRYSLCLIDLDRFKPVNDEYGHSAGDAMLKSVAGLIRTCCRRDDFCARIGGDEFALILIDCSAAGATCLAERVVDTVRAFSFPWQGETIAIGASAGIVEIDGTLEADTLYSRADQACYAAKKAGRNRVSLFGAD